MEEINLTDANGVKHKFRSINGYFVFQDLINLHRLHSVDIKAIEKVVAKAAKGDGLFLALGMDLTGVHSLPPLKNIVLDGQEVKVIRADLFNCVSRHMLNQIGYIYAVTFNNGSTKIGCSEKPDNRIRTVRCSTHEVATSSIISVPIPYYRQTEQYLHKFLLKKKIRGEWYVLGQKDAHRLIRELGKTVKEYFQKMGPSIHFIDKPKDIARQFIEDTHFIKKLAG